MLVASIELKFGGVVVEPGLPIPVDHGMSNHILQAQLNRRAILECDQARANEIRTRYLVDKKRGEEQHLKSQLAKLEASVEAAKHEVAKEAAEALAAESRLAAVAASRRAAESSAKVKLAALNAELARLSGSNGSGELQPSEPSASAGDPSPADDEADSTLEASTQEQPSYSKAQLKRLSLGELREVALTLNIEGAESASKVDIIDTIMSLQTEEN